MMHEWQFLLNLIQLNIYALTHILITVERYTVTWQMWTFRIYIIFLDVAAVIVINCNSFVNSITSIIVTSKIVAIDIITITTVMINGTTKSSRKSRWVCRTTYTIHWLFYRAVNTITNIRVANDVSGCCLLSVIIYKLDRVVGFSLSWQWDMCALWDISSCVSVQCCFAWLIHRLHERLVM